MGKDWATVKRKDGSLQWTYDGKPLYFYSTDKKKGDKTGDGIGGVWHIVSVCLAAAIDFEGALDRLRDAFTDAFDKTIPFDKEPGGARFGVVVTGAYSSLRAFRKSYAIARRYYDTRPHATRNGTRQGS
jgi:hypothetical protein